MVRRVPGRIPSIVQLSPSWDLVSRFRGKFAVLKQEWAPSLWKMQMQIDPPLYRAVHVNGATQDHTSVRGKGSGFSCWDTLLAWWQASVRWPCSSRPQQLLCQVCYQLHHLYPWARAKVSGGRSVLLPFISGPSWCTVDRQCSALSGSQGLMSWALSLERLSLWKR